MKGNSFLLFTFLASVFVGQLSFAGLGEDKRSDSSASVSVANNTGLREYMKGCYEAKRENGRTAKEAFDQCKTLRLKLLKITQFETNNTTVANISDPRWTAYYRCWFEAGLKKLSISDAKLQCERLKPVISETAPTQAIQSTTGRG